MTARNTTERAGFGSPVEQTRQFQQRGQAARVVACAVEDAVAGFVGFADAEVIPVRRIEKRLVGMGLTGDLADDVLRDDGFVLHLVVHGERDALQRDCAERVRLGLLLELLEVEAGLLEQLDGNVSLDPGFDIDVAAARGSLRRMSKISFVLEFSTVAQP